ncbi:hypothetical protein G210_2629, partial [Candida maltosa Xu316]
MIILRKSFYFAIWLFLTIGTALDVTENRVDRGVISLNFGDITIHSGASWSIINNAISTFVGSLDVHSDAALYISSTSPLIALQIGLASLFNHIDNDGLIVFDSRASFTPSNYNLVGAWFNNSGEMFLASSGIAASSSSLTALGWTNSGLIVFSQNQRNAGSVNMGTPGNRITNDGQICLINQVYRQATGIDGSGCITTDQDSTIYISTALLSIDPKQNFYLKDKDSSMVAAAASRTQTFNVYGFGNGNKVGINLPLVGSLLPPLPSYDYDEKTGILTLRNILVSQKFNIGTGYDPSLFRIVTDVAAGIPSTIQGSIAYMGPVPERELPAVCQIQCKHVPDTPGTDPTEYTSVIVSTYTDGSEHTETDVIDITTDSDGIWFTTTSNFTSVSTSSDEVFSSEENSFSYESSEFASSLTDYASSSTEIFSSGSEQYATSSTEKLTGYTTVFSSTISDGSVETETGIIIFTTNSDGSVYTTISILPQESSSTINELTEYTTTFTTTNSD